MNDYTLTNTNGMKMRVSSYGGTVIEIHAPDRDGRFADVALGFDSIDDYRSESFYFGALIGRCGNRLANGSFSIDGAEYQLAINNGKNHLHGGPVGFDKVDWDAAPIHGQGYTGLELRYISEDGEEGYPGRLDVLVTYKLTDGNEWIIEYNATTDKPTIVNLTQHSYFNLAGHNSGEILGHEISINADAYTPGDEGLIPTGEIAPVAGTPFDFRTPKPIMQEIGEPHVQIQRGGGYDHNFVLNKQTPGTPERAASVYEPTSGRTLEVLTTEPGVQFYSGNFLDGSKLGKGGVQYDFRNGFCLETQGFPDSPNQPSFPSIRLDPGERYHSTTIYRFGIR